MSDSEKDTWREYQKLVLSELRRLDGNMEKLGERVDRAVKHERGNRQTVELGVQAELTRIALEVQSLKIKAGVWGIMGGLLPAITAVVIRQL